MTTRKQGRQFAARGLPLVPQWSQDEPPAPPATTDLRAWAQTDLDAAGAGTVTFGPVPVGVVWVIQSVTVAIAGYFDQNPEAIAIVRYGPDPVAADDRWLGPVTIAGALDTAAGNPALVLYPGDVLRIDWTDGALTFPTATATIAGRSLPAP